MTAVSEQELKDHQRECGGKRVTLEGLKANIKGEQIFVVPGSMLTICVLTLQNGFTVTGESACADPAMFNAEIGERIARDNAEKKIWPLMGYSLRQEIYEAELATGEEDTFATRLKREERELADKLLKLEAFIDGNVQFERLSVEDQNDLREQAVKMHEYRGILARRLARITG